MTYYLGKNTKRNLKTLENKDLIVLVAQAILKTEQDFCIVKSGGKRTAQEQNAIFKKGYSKCDGYEKISYHQSGNAVDLVPFVDGQPVWDKDACIPIIKVMKELAKENSINLTCGADWGWDPFHYEIRG